MIFYLEVLRVFIEAILYVGIGAYLLMSYVVIPQAVLTVSKRSVKPNELKWLKALIIMASPLAMAVILGSKK